MYDIIVIGAGIGGYTAAIRGAKEGYKVAIIEKKDIGGVCLNKGCIPTKFLISEIKNYNKIKNCLEKGILEGNIKINVEKLKQNMEQKVNTLKNGIEYLLKQNNVDIYKGTAEFKDDNHVMIVEDELLIEAKYIIIATGSEPKIVNKQITESVYSSENIWEMLDKLPSSLAIVGMGMIGLEFAFIFSSLGVDITIIEEKQAIVEDVDKDFELEIKRMINNSKINVLFKKRAELIDKKNKINIYQNNERLVQADAIFYALGRVPSYDKLKLENTSIKITQGIIEVDENCKTSVDNIYCIGDANGRNMLAYVASAQAENAISVIKNNTQVKELSIVPKVFFLQEEMAYVGYTEKTASDKGIKIKTAKYLMSANGKSIIENNKGYIKIIVDETSKKIIGGSCVGNVASELINYITVAIKKEMKIDDFTKIVFPHPTYSESMIEAVDHVYSKSIHML